MKIAYQGNRGAFSEVIASHMYKDSNFFPCKIFKDVFEAVETGKTDLGMIPVENSSTGRVNEPTDLLIDSKLNVIAEGKLKIVHCIIAQEDSSLESIKQIYAHPQALLQSHNYLEKLKCELVSWHDGAAAAKIVKENKEIALIASEKVAKIYGLKVLKKGIQDLEENTTRFLVIAKEKVNPTEKVKTSIVFSTKHEPGALYNALGLFAEANVNLTRLESMPSRKKVWEYQFLIDFEGNKDDDNIKKVIKGLKEYATSIKILGSYSEGTTYE